MKKTSIVVYETMDYSMFKKLEGNRVVKDTRVDKIIESINKIGYVTSPILVNEKMEVIDGQGRLSALERLRMPVEYIIKEGIGIEECRNMNIHQKNWGTHDYVASFAVLGNENYSRLQSLLDIYSSLPDNVIIAAAQGWNPSTSRGGLPRNLKTGSMTVTAKDYERAKWELEYICKFQTVAKNIGGSKFPFYYALIYAYRNLDSPGRNKMETVIRQRNIELPALNNARDYLKYFDTFYNQGIRKGKIHLAHQFEVDHE